MSILEQRTWFNIAGRRTIDRLLAEQMKVGSELSFDVYQDPERGYQFLGRAPFWSSHEVYRADTRESKISSRLRGLRKPDETAFEEVQSYLKQRISGVHPLAGFEYYALWELMGLRQSFSREAALHLAHVMEMNLFSYGITKDDRLPPKVRRGYLFNLHFHIDAHFDPPSEIDLASSHAAPLYVGAYASSCNKTRIYMCHRGESEVLADIPNDPALAKKARALIDRPEVEAGYRDGRLRILVRSGQLLGAVHLFSHHRGTLEQIWSLTGRTLDEIRERYFSHYEEFEGGFVAESAVPPRAERFTLYAFNANKLGRVVAVA
ncbi:MAG: hypothetical protein QNJ30_27825 [Kiloniellales bacterium]|nr:hypothetical protein [Kiloniellales bacterium]